jgi:hypothetical protein
LKHPKPGFWVSGKIRVDIPAPTTTKYEVCDALIVDDFGIKYMSEDDLNHLVKTLQQYYDVTVDYDGKEMMANKIDNRMNN